MLTKKINCNIVTIKRNKNGQFKSALDVLFPIYIYNA